jgi:hypothetical protein
MRAYFEDGSVISTDNAPMPLHLEILDKQEQVRKLEIQIKRLTRLDASRADRKLAQAMRSDCDTLLATVKKLMHKYQDQQQPLGEA